MLNLMQRNPKMFFRQKSAVFFSLLGVIIIIALYLLFLGDVWRSNFGDIPGAGFLMDSWIMAGTLAVTAITTTMGAFGSMVNDIETGVIRDFKSAPLKRYQIAGGYLASAYVIGLIMSLATLILAEAYILIGGGELLPFDAMIKVLGVLLISVMASSSMTFFLVSFFTNNNAFGTACTVIGTMIGFLTGVYLPIGTLPSAMQWVIKLFPVSHSAALLRQVFLEAPIQQSFPGAPAAAVSEFNELMGVTLSYGDYTMTPAVHLIILVAVSALFFALTVLNLSRKNTDGNIR